MGEITARNAPSGISLQRVICKNGFEFEEEEGDDIKAEAPGNPPRAS